MRRVLGSMGFHHEATQGVLEDPRLVLLSVDMVFWARYDGVQVEAILKTANKNGCGFPLRGKLLTRQLGLETEVQPKALPRAVIPGWLA